MRREGVNGKLTQESNQQPSRSLRATRKRTSNSVQQGSQTKRRQVSIYVHEWLRADTFRARQVNKTHHQVGQVDLDKPCKNKTTSKHKGHRKQPGSTKLQPLEANEVWLPFLELQDRCSKADSQDGRCKHEARDSPLQSRPCGPPFSR